MTGSDLAAKLRNIAAVVENVETVPQLPRAVLTVEQQLGGLSVVNYLSDLFTASPKEIFTRDEILVALNLVKSDPEFFNQAIAQLLDDEAESEEVNET